MVIVFSLNGDNCFRDPSTSSYASVRFDGVELISQYVHSGVHCQWDSRIIVKGNKDYKIVKWFEMTELIGFPSCSALPVSLRWCNRQLDSRHVG